MNYGFLHSEKKWNFVIVHIVETVEQVHYTTHLFYIRARKVRVHFSNLHNIINADYLMCVKTCMLEFTAIL